MSNHDSSGCGVLDQGQFQKRALFKKSFCLLHLKADTSCIANPNPNPNPKPDNVPSI